MKLISALCFLVIAYNSFSQMSGTPKTFSISRKCLLEETKPVKIDTVKKQLTGKVSGFYIQPVKIDTAKNTTRVILRCGARVNSNNEPLIVVDGVIVEGKTLGELNPNEIERIDILKNAAATAIYGCHAVNGVIVITMKKSSFRKFIIKDFLDGSNIPGATVSFISADKKDTVMLAANDSGIVITNKLKSAAVYEMKVSAIGYQNNIQQVKRSYRYKEEEVLLSRNVKMCDEVILIQTYCLRRISCSTGCGTTLYCTISGLYVTYDSLTKSQPKINPGSFKIYPNPVQKGNTITLELKNSNSAKIIRILNSNGQELLRKNLTGNEGKNHFQINTETRWPPGIYIIQAIYENGMVAASDKVIIQ